MIRFVLLTVFLFICCNELPIGEEEFDIRGNFDAQELELTLNNALTEFDKFVIKQILYNEFELNDIA